MFARLKPELPFLMHLVLMLLWLLAIAILLSACSVVAPRVGPEVAKAVNRYCATVMPAERELLREQINAHIAPNSISVTCATDEPDG